MEKSNQSVAQATQKEISLLAYQLWEKEGRPQGRDVEFWLKAEAQLAACQSQNKNKEEVKAPIATAKAAPPAVKAPVQVVPSPIKQKSAAVQTPRRRK